MGGAIESIPVALRLAGRGAVALRFDGKLSVSAVYWEFVNRGRCFALQRRADGLGDSVRRLPYGIIGQMSVAACRLYVGMAKDFADDGESVAARKSGGREAVA